MISFITEYSVNICTQKTQNKTPWVHTVMKHAVHTYQWSYTFTPLICLHSMGRWNFICFLCGSIADSAALITVTDVVGSEQILTNWGYVDNMGGFGFRSLLLLNSVLFSPLSNCFSDGLHTTLSRLPWFNINQCTELSVCIKVVPSLLQMFLILFLMLSPPRIDLTRVAITPVPFIFSVRSWEPEN